MNEQKVRAIVTDMMTSGQYGVPRTPDHIHQGTDSPKIPITSLIGPNYFCVAASTNGTTAVNVFNNGSAPASVNITGVFLVSKDTTAGNITLANSGSTVALIAKGTVAGALVGATTLSYTAYSKGNTLTAVSSSTGNATLFVTFTI